MAEFCKECAKKVGMPFDGYPVFCEGCAFILNTRYLNNTL